MTNPLLDIMNSSLNISTLENISRTVIANGFMDKLIWKANTNGKYTVKSVWNAICYFPILIILLILWIIERLSSPKDGNLFLDGYSKQNKHKRSFS